MKGLQGLQALVRSRFLTQVGSCRWVDAQFPAKGQLSAYSYHVPPTVLLSRGHVSLKGPFSDVNVVPRDVRKTQRYVLHAVSVYPI